jgi:hypothetical protein
MGRWWEGWVVWRMRVVWGGAESAVRGLLEVLTGWRVCVGTRRCVARRV